MQSIEQKLRNYIAENILFSNDGYPYSDETSFLENGVIDSMNVMEIVAFVEESFGVDVEDREIVPSNFDSIRNVAAYLRNKGITLQ
ncbi:MAG: acyl carrier protein [Chloroflexota bacterium]|jgi:acyl carrier protein